ncbi:hypothetical protein FGB62_312g013 [Gracilaria domingensis]|nr:hypothetical protein FGB62_312g013 [Gracilaria domingensis]
MPSPSATTKEQIRKYERAIKRHNDIDAMVSLSEILCFDRHVPNDVPRGKQLLERAIKQADDPIAMGELAYCISVTGNAKERRRVIPLIEQALRISEDSWSLLLLSDVLLDGHCGEKDPIRAAQLQQRALRLEPDAQVMARVARKMLTTPSLKDEKNRALQLYDDAIGLTDDASIMNELGTLYYEGTPNLRRCDKRAIELFERAVDLEHGPAALNLAKMLTDRSVALANDPVRALQVLKDAHRRQPKAKYLVKMGDIYKHSWGVRDLSRAIKMYEQAVVRFSDRKARATAEVSTWVRRPAKDAYSLRHACSIVWSGGGRLEANPQRAVELAKARGEDWYGLWALMLRYDNGRYKRDIKLAYNLAQNFSNKVLLTDGRLIQAIILSEMSREEQDMQKAEHQFRQVMADKSSKHIVSWTAIALRQCAFDLPFHGGRECISEETRTFKVVYDLAVLNLASLLLERNNNERDTGKEVIDLLEGLLTSGVKVIACLNLVHVLWHGVGGVQRERKRAMELLEDIVAGTRNLSALSMLANALAERKEANDEEIKRSMDLWKKVENRAWGWEELDSCNRFISDKTWTVWNSKPSKRSSDAWSWPDDAWGF